MTSLTLSVILAVIAGAVLGAMFAIFSNEELGKFLDEHNCVVIIVTTLSIISMVFPITLFCLGKFIEGLVLSTPALSLSVTYKLAKRIKSDKKEVCK